MIFDPLIALTNINFVLFAIIFNALLSVYLFFLIKKISQNVNTTEASALINGIAMMGVILLSKIFSGIAVVYFDKKRDLETTKRPFISYIQIILGIIFSSTAIIVNYLALNKKITPEVLMIFEKIFASFIGIALICSIALIFLSLIGGLCVNKSMIKEEAERYTNLISKIIDYMNIIIGASTPSIVGTLEKQIQEYCKEDISSETIIWANNYVNREDDNVKINCFFGCISFDVGCKSNQEI